MKIYWLLNFSYDQATNLYKNSEYCSQILSLHPKYLLQRKTALLFRELLVKIPCNTTLMKYALPWRPHYLFYKHWSRALKVGEIGRFYFAFGGNCGGTHSLSLFPYKPSTMNHHSTPIFVSHTIIGLKIVTDYPLDVI